jgi:hypothetical protein
MSKYEIRAINFCSKYDVKIDCKYLGLKNHFNDGIYHKTYSVTIKRGKEEFSFRYGASEVDTGDINFIEPSKYDILSCLTKYDPEYFEFFCDNYGYSYETKNEKRKIEKIYYAVVREWKGVERIFGDFTTEQWDEFREI